MKNKKDDKPQQGKPWHRMTSMQKRIAIAEDVIAQIRNKTFIAEEGNYGNLFDRESKEALIFEADFKELGIDKEKQAKKLLEDKVVGCQACAVGTIFAAHVMRTNHLKAGDFEYEAALYKIKERLEGIFTYEQLDLIETAFEGQVININPKIPREDIEKAIMFGKAYNDPNKKLIAICKNIIKNQGTFIP